jgi:hypothetical protein
MQPAAMARRAEKFKALGGRVEVEAEKVKERNRVL